MPDVPPRKTAALALCGIGVALVLLRGAIWPEPKVAATMAMLVVATGFGLLMTLTAGFVAATAMRVDIGPPGMALAKTAGAFLAAHGTATVLRAAIDRPAWAGPLCGAALIVPLVAWLFRLRLRHALAIGAVLFPLEMALSYFVKGVLNAHPL